MLGPFVELLQPVRILGACEDVAVVCQIHDALCGVDALPDHVLITGYVALALDEAAMDPHSKADLDTAFDRLGDLSGAAGRRGHIGEEKECHAIAGRQG